jgi:hypothetical protein
MTISEFRAWLEGFECSFQDGVPNAEQWGAVKARMARVGPLPAPSAPLVMPKGAGAIWPYGDIR